MSRPTIAAIAAAILAGCFSPSLPADLRCQNDFICPDGFFCDPTDFVCRTIGSSGDAGTVDADPADGSSGSSFCADDDIVLCLEFEDNLDDGSRRDNTVSSTSNPFFVDGDVGRALSLNGTYSLSIERYRPGSGSETIEMWLTVPNNDQNQVVMESDTEVELAVRGRQLEAISANELIGSPELAVGVLHHAAIRITDQSFELFVDGVRIDDKPFTDGSATPQMALGADLEGLESYVGQIDQLRVWTRSLSASEISDIASGR